MAKSTKKQRVDSTVTITIHPESGELQVKAESDTDARARILISEKILQKYAFLAVSGPDQQEFDDVADAALAELDSMDPDTLALLSA